MYGLKDANGCLSDKLISEKVGEPGKIELTSIVTPSVVLNQMMGILI